MSGNVNNINGILDAMGIREEFEERAKAAFEKARESSDDSSIFDSRENFVEHYSDEIMGGNNINSIPMDDFMKTAKESGYLDNDKGEIDKELAADLEAAVNRNGDNVLSREESELMLNSVYDAATVLETSPIEGQTATTDKKDNETKELYQKVAVDPWGEGPNDCLSRIIQNNVEGIELYSSDYNQYIQKTCELNGIEDPNIIYGEIKLPEIKRGSNNEILKDANGNIQFYSEEELKNR